MATRYAVASTAWSLTSTWDGGVSVPGSGDDVYANGFTVAIDTTITVQTLRTTSNASPVIAAGGGFTANNGVSITVTGASVGGSVWGLIQGSTSVLTVASTNGCTITGNFGPSQSNTTSLGSLQCTGTGTINVVGNISGSTTSSNGAYGIMTTGNCTLNITGNITGSTASTGNIPINIQSAATINITGNIVANNSRCIITTGNNAYTLNVTGNVTNNLSAISIDSAAVATFSINVTGTVTGSGIAAINCSGTSTTGIVTLNGSMVNASSYMAIFAPRVRISSSTTQSWKFQTSGSDRFLYTADNVLGQPAVTDVRNGVVYASGSLTGTCYVPAAASVAYGVPVDATTGTAVLTRAQLISDVGAIVAAYTV